MSVKLPLHIYSIDKDYIVFDTPEGEEGYNLINWLERCKPSCVAEFWKIRKRRSTGDKSANHHFYGHLMQICREIGCASPSEIEQVKTYIKEVAHNMFGYPRKEIKPGVYIYQSEADNDTLQESWLIESAHWVAADLGIILVETE